MKSDRFIHILHAMINNEVVRFEADDGTRIVITRHISEWDGRKIDRYTLTNRTRQDRMLSAVFFDRVEDDGGDIRLYDNASIVGMVFTKAIEVESESIYS